MGILNINPLFVNIGLVNISSESNVAMTTHTRSLEHVACLHY